MLCVYRVHMDNWSRRYGISDDIMKSNIWKTKWDTSLTSIEDVYEIIYAESNGHMTDDVTYDITVVTPLVIQPWNYFRSIPTYVIMIPERYRRTDDGITMLCVASCGNKMTTKNVRVHFTYKTYTKITYVKICMYVSKIKYIPYVQIKLWFPLFK